MQNYYDYYFRPFPVITTERLVLRSVRLGDLQDIYDYCSRPEVAEYVAWSPHEDINASRDFITWVQKGYRKRTSMVWAIEEQETHRMIGTCSFVKIDAFYKIAEIGYVVSPNYWGKGYASEAGFALMRFGFQEIGLQRLEARCMVENKQSVRVMEKLGMTLEGVLQKGVFCKGTYHHIKLYAITDERYFLMMG